MTVGSGISVSRKGLMKFGITSCIVITAFSLFSNVSFAFEINGTVYDIYGNSLNATNVSVLIKDQTWTSLGTNSTATNSTGWFNLTLPGTVSDHYMYQLSLVHRNNTTNAVDFVGQSLPTFPFPEFSRLSSVNFYLKDAGTINITVINANITVIDASNNSVPNNQFSYQVKDQKLGYPVQGCSNSGTYDSICYVPRDRNYSIMIYPAQGSPQHFVPVSFNWYNFTSNDSYTISTLSSSNYNGTIKHLNKQFNVTESSARISGYLNSSSFNITGWEELTIVPFLLEPPSMIFMTYGILPFNASAWTGSTDVYNISLNNSNASAFYNISLPYSPAETVNYILFAAAKNGSSYGSYKNITVSGNAQLNFTMYGLLGNSNIINMTGSTGGFRDVNTSRQVFRLVNATNNNSLSNINAHIETTVDYSNYGAIEFTFMEDLSGGNYGNFSLPLLNATGVKEMNIFTMSGAPKRVPTKTAAQIIANNNISLSAFNPGDIDGRMSASSIYVSVYKSNSTCDVPSPPSGCVLSSSASMGTFNPFASVVGGGALSFRMGMTSNGIEIHYVNVDMLASGPPDGMFDSATTNSTTGGFSSAMRFGSNGPTIYDYILISMPYTEGNSSQTGLNESGEVNMSIPAFYDENWNVAWNVSLNGTNSTLLAGNNSHYSTYSNDWSSLMQNTTCVTNTTLFNTTNPCYIDTATNRIWIRLPHFSGTGPKISGATITYTPPTTTTSSSGGGGGGSIATAPSIKVNTTKGKATITVTSISANKMANVTINKTEDMAVSRIEITVKNSVSNIQIIVTKLDSKPASIVHEITGKVYHYIKMTKTNINDTNINKTKISFKVERSWINSSNINESTIVLNRYADNKWNRLSTIQTSSDGTYIYYEAESPGMSVFAISGEEKITAPAAAPEEKKPEETKPAGETIAEVSKKPLTYVYLIIGFVVIAAAVFFFKRKDLMTKR